MSINIKTDKGLVKIAPTSYNELTDLPNIKSNGNTTYITDKSGNNVATIDSGGISTTGIVVDNITLGGKDISQTIAEGSFSGDFKDLTNNPIADNSDGSVSFADASGNKIAAINAEGVESVEFKAGNHKLTEKADQAYVLYAITELENAAFSGDYNDLENAPIDNINDGTILFTDELGNKIGQIDESGFTSTEFIAGSHKLTNKAEHNAPLANFVEDSEHQLVSSSEKTYWSNKSDFSGKFSDLEENPIIDNKDGQIEYQDNEGNTIVRIDSLGISTTAVSINEGDVATLIDGKADKSSLNASNNRISTLETKVTNQGSSISQIQSDVDGINGELSTFKSTVESTYATKTSLSDVDTRVTSAEEEIDVLQSNVDNIQTTVDTHASKVANIESSEGEFVIVDEGSNKGLTLTSDGVLYVKEVGVSGGLVDERLKSIENYFSTEEDADNNLNKWNEIVNFLNGFEETDQVLENIIATKADKSTVTSLESAYKTADTNLGTRIDGIITDVNRKQDIISDLATIRSGAAKGATALQSYTETDPVFKASAAANITTNDITNWNNKTSNSGTITEVKANGTSIATSGSANIPAASTSVYGVTKLSSSTSSTSEALAATPKAVKAAYDLAASKTSNIGTITGITMNGVSKGTSGVVDLGTVVTNVNNLASKTELTDAINNIDFYAIKDNPIIEEASGTLTFADPSGNIGFVFEGNIIHVQDVTTGTHTLSNKLDKLVSGTNIKTINGTSILGSGNINITGGSSITESTISGWGFTKNTGTVTSVKVNGSTKNPSNGVVDLGTVITSHQDISGKADKSSLATVATSGSYNDLSNKPTIPSAVTESTVSGWGFTKNSGTYSKPSGGIPKSDLASAVLTSLGKADTALQSHQDISGKQDKLVSGTNIKTINGESILGSGDIVINSSSSEETTITDGVYAVTADEKLINYNEANESCIGVALVAGEHKFMIAKSDVTNDGVDDAFHWGKNLYKKDVAGVVNNSKVDDTNADGFLPQPDGTFLGPRPLSDDFTTWTAGALAEFNGKANTAAIINSYTEHGVEMYAGDMCSVLNTFNASDSHNDWYVPACGQLALMYLNMTEINAALAKIGGTTIAASTAAYWSSSEADVNFAWHVNFFTGCVSTGFKNDSFNLVRFVRDIKLLKEKIVELESNKADKTEIPTKVSQLENDIHYIKGKTIKIGSSTSLNLDPDIYLTTDIKSDLTVSIKDNLSSTTLPVHFFGMFSFGNTVYNITWPSNIKWVSRPSYYEANSQYHYEIVFGLNYTFGKIYKIADDLIANTSDAINIYTIDIRDWDLKSDKEISITNEDAARICNADIIRFLDNYILSDDLSLLCYIDATLSIGVGDEREGIFSYTGFTETGLVVATISNLFDNIWSMTLSAYNNAYRRSAFFIGEYDEETDNWDNSLIADILEQNVLAFKNLYYITLNPSEFNDRTSIQVMEATGDISIINKYRYLEDEEVMEMIYERYDIDSKNKTVWLIVIGKDGVPSYQKIL